MEYYGQSKPPEDKIAHAVFGDDFVGTCVEVGAYNGVDLSNTYFFYKRGWRCINFEPHPDNYAALCKNQPRAINFCGACGAKNNPSATLWTAPDKPIVTGVQLPEWYVNSEVSGGRDGLVPMLATMWKLESAFEFCGVSEIDYVSIDTDGSELDVLKGMYLYGYKPRLMVIEYNHALNEINDFLEDRDYYLTYQNTVNGFWTRTKADYDAVRRAVQ